MTNSFVLALWQSRIWKLLRPLREARRLLRPRGFDAAALLPWHDLEPDREAAPGTWLATGSHPFFIVPCQLPAGPLRIRLKMNSENAGRSIIYGVGGNNIADLHCLKQLQVKGPLELDEIVELPRPILGIRLDPLDGPGRFHLETLQVMPVPPTKTIFSAWRNRLGRLLARRADSLPNPQGSGQEAVGAAPANGTAQSDGSVEDRKLSAATAELRIGTKVSNRLDIVYVLKNVGLCGGVKVVMEHASRLRARGHNVCVYYLAGGNEWFGRLVPMIQFDTEELLQAALANFRGIKIATWYETAPWVAESCAWRSRLLPRPGHRGVLLLDPGRGCYGAGNVPVGPEADYRGRLGPRSNQGAVRPRFCLCEHRPRFGYFPAAARSPRDAPYPGPGSDLVGRRSPARTGSRAGTPCATPSCAAWRSTLGRP